jgi:dethiobiotin synthetase
MRPIFITGIGTSVGKTLVAAILTEALKADYWKPVQAGFDQGTDSEWISGAICNSSSKIHPELYKLKLAVSPHIAAEKEGKRIDLGRIKDQMQEILNCRGGIEQDLWTNQENESGFERWLVIEGAGGLLAPLNEKEFVLELIQNLQCPVILVSRNYLGSINHSLMTARVCQYFGLSVCGWVFNDQYLDYEDEICKWTHLPKIASIPHRDNPGKDFILEQATRLDATIRDWLHPLP